MEEMTKKKYKKEKRASFDINVVITERESSHSSNPFPFETPFHRARSKPFCFDATLGPLAFSDHKKKTPYFPRENQRSPEREEVKRIMNCL